MERREKWERLREFAATFITPLSPPPEMQWNFWPSLTTLWYAREECYGNSAPASGAV